MSVLQCPVGTYTQHPLTQTGEVQTSAVAQWSDVVHWRLRQYTNGTGNRYAAPDNAGGPGLLLGVGVPIAEELGLTEREGVTEGDGELLGVVAAELDGDVCGETDDETEGEAVQEGDGDGVGVGETMDGEGLAVPLAVVVPDGVGDDEPVPDGLTNALTVPVLVGVELGVAVMEGLDVGGAAVPLDTVGDAEGETVPDALTEADGEAEGDPVAVADGVGVAALLPTLLPPVTLLRTITALPPPPSHIPVPGSTAATLAFGPPAASAPS